MSCTLTFYEESENVHAEVCKHISGAHYTDEQIAETIRKTYNQTGYLLDPHGACGFQALKDYLPEDVCGVFLETAHPAKFKGTVDSILGGDILIPEKLQAFMKGEKHSTELIKDFDDFKRYLMELV